MNSETYEIPVSGDAIEFIRKYVDGDRFYDSDYGITTLAQFFDELVAYLGDGKNPEEDDWIYENCINEFVHLSDKFYEIESRASLNLDYECVTFVSEESGETVEVDFLPSDDEPQDNFENRDDDPYFREP